MGKGDGKRVRGMILREGDSTEKKMFLRSTTRGFPLRVEGPAAAA